MSLSLVAAASVTANSYVAGILNGPEGRGALFVNASGTPLNGIASSLPQVGSIVQVTDPQGTADGPWKVHLTSQAVDTVNGSSPMNYVLDINAYFLIASTSNG